MRGFPRRDDDGMIVEENGAEENEDEEPGDRQRSCHLSVPTGRQSGSRVRNIIAEECDVPRSFLLPYSLFLFPSPSACPRPVCRSVHWCAFMFSNHSCSQRDFPMRGNPTRDFAEKNSVQLYRASRGPDSSSLAVIEP